MNRAAVIREFRSRAAAAYAQSRMPITEEYRLKDYITDEWYANRYERAAEWLERTAGAETLAELYPNLAISRALDRG